VLKAKLAHLGMYINQMSETDSKIYCVKLFCFLLLYWQ